MILTCPDCTTRYQTDAALFAPPGRKVRCAKCGHVWQQEAPPDEFEAGIEAAEPPPPRPMPAPEPTPRRTAYAPPQQEMAEIPEIPLRSPWPRRIGLGAGWIGLVAIVLVIGGAATAYRQEIATLWPQAASLYARLGLDVNARGIAFVNIASHREAEDGQSVLAVTGKLVNISAREMPVPAIRVTLTGSDERELYHWDFTPSVTILHAGQAVNFLTRLSSPPPGARHVEIRFAGAGG
jgi:predicted Zn finger-like uncharacterized protein